MTASLRSTICVAISLSMGFVQAEDWHFTGPNVAHKKQAFQWKGTHYDNYASKAVDGGISTDLMDGTCSHTDGNATIMANWTVDLGRAYLIKGVRIYNRKFPSRNPAYMKVTERLKGFYIIGSAPGRSVLYNDSKNVNQQYKAEIIEIRIEPVSTFSKLTVQLPHNPKGHPDDFGYSVITLCEVQVYAAFCELNKTFKSEEVIAYSNSTESIQGREYINSGTEIRFRCNEKSGYNLVGTTTATCLMYGNYSNGVPECKKVCDSLPDITNGKYMRSGKFLAGDEVQWKCNTFYEPAYSMIRCSVSGKWNQRPVCNDIQCTYPYWKDVNLNVNLDHLLFENGSIYEKSSIIAGSYVHAFCKEGYMPNIEKMKCSITREWIPSPSALSCTPIKCESLTAENGYFTYSNVTGIAGSTYSNVTGISGSTYSNVTGISGSSYSFGTIATIHCDVDFEIVSPTNTLKCGHQDGSWEGTSVFCEKPELSDNVFSKPLLGISISVAMLVLIGILLAVVCIVRRKRRREHNNIPESPTPLDVSYRRSQGTYENIAASGQAATFEEVDNLNNAYEALNDCTRTENSSDHLYLAVDNAEQDYEVPDQADIPVSSNIYQNLDE